MDEPSCDVRESAKCSSRIFTKYKSSRVSLRRTKIEASIRKKYIPKAATRIYNGVGVPQKRHNLYAYPKSYYDSILNNLEREAL